MQENLEFLRFCKIDNKTHIKVLSSYWEMKFIRIFVFLVSLLALITTKNHYLFFASMFYILLEIFFYRYYKLLLKKYELTQENGLLKRQD